MDPLFLRPAIGGREHWEIAKGRPSGLRGIDFPQLQPPFMI
jgi:hypothetical protein